MSLKLFFAQIINPKWQNRCVSHIYSTHKETCQEHTIPRHVPLIISSHHLPAPEIGFGLRLGHLGAPQSVDVAVGIDRNRFACETNLDFGRVILFQIAQDASHVGLQTHETYVVLRCHRVWFLPDLHFQSMPRDITHITKRKTHPP